MKQLSVYRHCESYAFQAIPSICISGVVLQMQPATTFNSIELALCLLSEAQISVAGMSQQGQSINGELLSAFFIHDIIVVAN